MTEASSGRSDKSEIQAWLRQAQTQHEGAQLELAEKSYQKVLSVEPNHSEALLQLGVIRLQQGQPELGMDLTRRALAVDGKSAEAHSNLATALHMLHRYDEAILAYETAITCDPNRAEAYYGLGTALQAVRRYEEAVACFERALILDPEYPEALCGLGASCHALKRLEKSLECYTQALGLAPDLADAHLGCGMVLNDLHKERDAAVAFRRALELSPSYAEAHHGLGIALQAADSYDQALLHFTTALSLKPNFTQAAISQGTALNELGRTDEAVAAFEHAFELEPENPGACYALIRAKKVRVDDPCLQMVEKLGAELSALGDDDKIRVHFALAKADIDLERNEQGFKHILDANRIRRQRGSYDEPATLSALGKIGDAFTPELLLSGMGAGNPSELPIFIVGMPRSGSTLVEQILASHPLVFAGGERLGLGGALKKVGVDITKPSFEVALRELGGDKLREFSSLYLSELTRAALSQPDAIRVSDKMLANFCFVGLIHLALPNARIVHTRRDPVDTCLSCFSTLFEQPFACDLGELGRYYVAYERLMRHWRFLLPKDRMLEVQYEDVVEHLEAQARRIVAYCGLPWDDRCLAFHKASRPVKTASVNQVRQPIYRTSVGRWRPSEDVLKPLLQGLGLLPTS